MPNKRNTKIADYTKLVGLLQTDYGVNKKFKRFIQQMYGPYYSKKVLMTKKQLFLDVLTVNSRKEMKELNGIDFSQKLIRFINKLAGYTRTNFSIQYELYDNLDPSCKLSFEVLRAHMATVLRDIITEKVYRLDKNNE